MRKEVFSTLLRELHDERPLPLPQNFYDKALSYVHSLKIRKSNEVSDVQRKIWEEEIRILERLLMAIRKMRMRKMVMEVMSGSTVEGLPPEEEVSYNNLKRAFEFMEIETKAEVSEALTKEKGLYILKKSLDDATASKLGIPKLDSEDIIFINKRIGKVLIDLGLADEINVR